MIDNRGSNALFWSNTIDAPADRAVVLFSGGRDSTLAAVRCIINGQHPILINFDTGFGTGRSLVNNRIDELEDCFGKDRITFGNVPIYGLVRSVACRDLVEDVQKYGANLIPLGESLAMHAAAIVIAKQLSASHVVNGFSGYQSNLPEQIPTSISTIRRFVESYDIKLITPLAKSTYVQDVQYELIQYGITPKSLESVSIFADCCEPVEDEVSVIDYIESKLPILGEFVQRLIGADLESNYDHAIGPSISDREIPIE
ncbi:hypothetical protein ACIOD2_01780 [Amycolatopsis sp. NPDC088138]|uniref:hypothetical protein n=1 Tax=Amycolatopsis sp. NPDC088138 TaxID=3363938 RepID=UPI003814EF19